jgi:membrane-associated phospholipid phosphatase
MEPIDQVVFAKKLKKEKGELTLFPKTAELIRLPVPSPNSSYETGKDLLLLSNAQGMLDPFTQKSIQKHDKDAAYAVKLYLDIFGLEYDERFIQEVLDESTIIIIKQKNKFNRPRPIQLSPYFGVDLNPLSSKSNKTPSYPSGHSTQSRLIAEIYGEMYPSHRKNLIKASEECGFGRIVAGFHYPSDHSAGVYLAKRLFKSLLTQKAENTTYYNTVFTFSSKK